MNLPSLVVATTTVASAEQARALARQIIDQRCAACVQIDGPIVSHYLWNEVAEESSEWRLTIKTTASAEPALAELVHRLHPYELPQWWVAVPQRVSPGYSQWVKQSVALSDAGSDQPGSQ